MSTSTQGSAIYNLNDHGAIGDGTTDDTSAMLAAVQYAAVTPGTVIYLASAKYNFGSVPSSGFAIPSRTTIRGAGQSSTRIIWNDTLGNTLFASAGISASSVSDIVFEDFTVTGSWNSDNAYAGYPFIMFWVRGLTFRRVTSEYSMGMGIAARNCVDVVAQDCTVRYAASDGISFSHCANASWVGNTIEHIEDDAISGHSSVGDPWTVRRNMVVTGNRIFDCQGMRFMAARDLVVSGNQLDCVRQQGINIATVAAAGGTEGNAAALNIVISNNTISNVIQRSAVDYQGVNGCPGIVISGASARQGTAAAIPGEANTATGTVVDPYPYIFENDSASTTPTSGSAGITITGNTIKRTLPACNGTVTNPATGKPFAKFSDYGAGPIFTKHGWVDPSLSENDMRDHGVVIGDGIVRDVLISGNVFSGLFSGLGINDAIRLDNIVFKDNVVSDCLDFGVLLNSDANIRVYIYNNLFDLDPFHKHPNRGADGTWQTFGYPSAFWVQRGAGVTFRGNTIRNAASDSNHDTDTPWLTNWIDGNIVEADPVTSGFSSLNKGVGLIRGSGGSLVVQTDSDPSSVTFGQQLTVPPTSAASIPTSGKFVLGHFLRNSAPSQGPSLLQGWVRTTTGTGAAIGTDWAPIYALSALASNTLVGNAGVSGQGPQAIGIGANLLLSAGQLSAVVPVRTSQLANDSGFLTNAQIPSRTSQLANDAGFLTATTLPYASTTAFGVLKVDGSTVVMNNGTLSAAGGSGTPATTSRLGGIIVGSGLNITATGTLSTSALQLATSLTAGIVVVGSGLTVNAGTIVLATPNASLLGSDGTNLLPVVIGNGLSFSQSGTLSATAAGLSIPSSGLIGGTGSALTPVAVGAGLVLNSGTLTASAQSVGPAGATSTGVVSVPSTGGLAVSAAGALSVSDVSAANVTGAFAGATGRTIAVRVIESTYNLLDGGAVGDGTTDDSVALAGAIAYATANPGTIIYLPSGKFYFGTIPSGGFKIPSQTTIRGAGQTRTKITWADAAGIQLFGSTGTSGTPATDIVFEDFTVTGGLATTTSLAGYPFIIYWTNGVTFRRVTSQWSRGMGIAARNCTDAKAIDCTVRYCGSDGISFSHCANATFVGNTIEHGQDDGISCHSSVGDPWGVRKNILVTGNRLFDTQGMKFLGARHLIVSGNQLDCVRSQGINITTTPTTSGATEGNVAAVAISITGNTITNLISRTNVDAGGGNNQGCPGIYVNGASARSATLTDGSSSAIPGEQVTNDGTLTGAVADPYPYMFQNTASPSTATPGSYGIVIAGNIIKRTLPACNGTSINPATGTAFSQFSDYGFGQIFTLAGWRNPALAESDYQDYAVAIAGGVVRDVLISGNTFSGLKGGLEFNAATRYDNIHVRDNMFSDLTTFGIFLNTSGTNNITVEHNTFDMDPFYKHPKRGTNGTWVSASVSGPNALYINSGAGITFRRNTIRNAAQDVNKGTDTPLANILIDANVIEADVSGTGFSPSNKGVGYVRTSGNTRVVQVDADPASSTFGQTLTVPQEAATAIPSIGKFVLGHFIRNSAPAAGTSVLTGWARVTTGIGNTLGTDWSAVYGLSSIPPGTLIGNSGTAAAGPAAITAGAGLVLAGGTLSASYNAGANLTIANGTIALAGTIDNVVVGAATPLAGKFSTLSAGSGSFSAGGDSANGNIAIGNSAGTLTPYIDFMGNGVTGKNVRLINDADGRLSIQAHGTVNPSLNLGSTGSLLSSAAVLSGGTLNGAVIGASAAAAGTFTTLSVNTINAGSGTFSTGGDSNGSVLIGRTTNTNGTPYIDFIGQNVSTGHSVRMINDGAGQISIYGPGSGSNPGANLNVAGSISATGSITSNGNVVLTTASLATTSQPGAIVVGSGLSINAGGTISTTGTSLTVPSSPIIGGNGTSLTSVTIGSGLTFGSGTLAATGYALPQAGTATLGGVVIGANVNVSSGTISVAAPLSVPSSGLLGGTGAALTGVAVGTGLAITSGTLNATGTALTIPSSSLLGGNGSALTAVALGSGLVLSGGTLSSTGSGLVAATTTTPGVVVVGSNVTVNNGTISVGSANVSSALGYVPAPSVSVSTNMTSGAFSVAKSPNAQWIIIRAWGGGGGGGYGAVLLAGQSGSGGGGGGGGACVFWEGPASAVPSTITGTIGNGGTAGVSGAATGGVGGSTTVNLTGLTLTAKGGGGGSGGASATASGGGGGASPNNAGSTASAGTGGSPGSPYTGSLGGTGGSGGNGSAQGYFGGGGGGGGCSAAGVPGSGGLTNDYGGAGGGAGQGFNAGAVATGGSTYGGGTPQASAVQNGAAGITPAAVGGGSGGGGGVASTTVAGTPGGTGGLGAGGGGGAAGIAGFAPGNGGAGGNGAVTIIQM